MKENRRILNIDDVIGDRTATAEVRAEIRANLPKIYLSKENLSKLESFGFGRAEILMAHSPNDFVSMSSAEVLREFGICPFDKEIALKMMSRDYIVNNYSELINLGAKIDFNVIFDGVSRELGEYYADKLTDCEVIDYDRLVGRLHYRAIFFLANNLLLYGATPKSILKRLDSDEIKIHFGTLKRYGLKSSEIKARIEQCSKSEKEGVECYCCAYGRVYRNLPVRNITCLNCLNNHVYYGYPCKHFCCDRCRQTFMYKCDARREVMEEQKHSKEKTNAKK